MRKIVREFIAKDIAKITGDDAAEYFNNIHTGSGDGIPVGNLAVRAAIATQNTDPETPIKDVSAAIHEAYK